MRLMALLPEGVAWLLFPQEADRFDGFEAVRVREPRFQYWHRTSAYQH